MPAYKVIGKSGIPIKTPETLHPGEVLLMELEARQLKKFEFATQLNIQPSQLSELLHQKRHVNALMAIKLETLLGIDAEFWMRLQTAYDISVERKRLEHAQRA
ncbi:MAG: HigA family addiction module antidote protein [Lewinellaceae bacterium]|nr:HigA family addiction module antidote protein [Lewinellaceae bacterium]